MKFKSIAGKLVFDGVKIITFKNDIYETSDKKEIEALSKARNVSEVKQSKSKLDK